VEEDFIQTLHVATIAQEALLLFIVETLRFKSSSIVKINKLGGLVASFKTLRTNAFEVLKEIAAALLKRNELENTVESRQAFIDGVTILTDNEITHDFALNVVKRVADARKKILEGVSKGMTRVCATYSA